MDRIDHDALEPLDLDLRPFDAADGWAAGDVALSVGVKVILIR
jgi:hypothetical protein